MSRTPLLLLTGFLGSGKTTLVNRLLADPAFRETAVVINEAGLVGIDHLLVEHGTDGVMLLEGGCLCCRDDHGLAAALAALLRRRRPDGSLPFARVLVETSGLADPLPLLQGIASDIVFHRHFCLAGVVTTVDGRAFATALTHHREVLMQVSLADRLVVTKADLISAGDLLKLRDEVQRLNPNALCVVAGEDRLPAAALSMEAFDLDRLHRPPPAAATSHPAAAIVEASRRFSGRLDPDDLDGWLADTLSLFGPALLRLKGLLAVVGEPEPIVVHAVLGLLHGTRAGLHPPVTGDNRLVLIGRDIERALLVGRLDMLAALAASGAGVPRLDAAPVLAAEA